MAHGRAAQLYNSKAWRSLRKRVLYRDAYTCRMCGLVDLTGRQLVADHIKPLSTRWDLRLDADNIQTLCKRCHDTRKREQERLADRGLTRDADGWLVRV